MAARMVLLKDLKVPELKFELRRRRQMVTGHKVDLIDRLTVLLLHEGLDPATHQFVGLPYCHNRGCYRRFPTEEQLRRHQATRCRYRQQPQPQGQQPVPPAPQPQ